MINKNIEDITKDVLQVLIDEQIIERKTLEYKRKLPSNSEKDKKEFLADISSFANASGGDIVFGMAEDRNTGKPMSLDGLDVDNFDEEIRTLENLIESGIQPRLIPPVSSQMVPLDNDRKALIIRIPKTINSPHRVSFQGKGHGKFFTRSSNGKHPMDMDELRNAFNLSETITEKIRDFRTDRITKILANEAPVLLYDNPKTVLHLVPITSFSLAQNYDITKVASNHTYMPPIDSAGWNDRYNLDGVITYSREEGGKSPSYTQFFRNGILEAVESTILKPSGEETSIPSTYYEKILIESLTAYLSLFKSLNIEPPIYIFLTLLDVKGYYLAVNRNFRVIYKNKIDRDYLQLPENIIESYDTSATQLLKPCFDSLWNACGFPRDLNYDEKEKWNPPR